MKTHIFLEMKYDLIGHIRAFVCKYLEVARFLIVLLDLLT